MQTKKIFLASSEELKADRDQFEIFIGRRNKEWHRKGVFLELLMWEDFHAVLHQGRPVHGGRVHYRIRAVPGHQQTVHLSGAGVLAAEYA